MLSVRDLRKTFTARRGAATVALDGADLDVADGSFTTVLGPSGSGKTTLLRCIAGFERPDDGVIELAGRTLDSPSVRSVRPHTRGIGVVPQEGALFPHLTVAQNVGFGLVGTTRAGKRHRVDELLDLVGMGDLGDRRPHELSGGQQQRVALARALAPEPKLILLDEPFSALDAKLRVELRDDVRRLLGDIGATAMLVTHDQAEALTMADHLVVMRDGRVVAAGRPRDVYERPPDVDTARFLGDATILPGIAAAGIDGVRVDCALGCLPVAAGFDLDGPCQVLVRPEQLAIDAGPVDPWGCKWAGAAVGTVTEVSYRGADMRLHVGLQGPSMSLTVRALGQCRYETGDIVRVATNHAVCIYPV